MEFDSEEEREIFGNGSDDDEENMESEYASTDEDVKFLKPAAAMKAVEEVMSLKEKEQTQEDISKDEVDLERHISRPRLFSKSNSPTLSSESEEEMGDIFSEDTSNFSAEIVNQASSFISAAPPEHLIPATDDIGLPEGLFNPHSPETTPPESPGINVTDFDQSVYVATEEEEEGEGQQREQAMPTQPSKRASKSKRRCEECEACMRETDCRKCRFCCDMKKYGGPGKLRQKCIKRQCLKLSRILYQDDSKSMKIKEDLTKRNVESSSLDIISNSLTSKSENRAVSSSLTAQPFYSSDTSSHVSLATSTRPPPIKPNKKPGSKKPVKRQQQSKRKPVKRTRHIEPKYSSDSEEDYRDQDFVYKGRKRRPLRDLYDVWSANEEPVKTQCLGPGCMYAARPHSKYCSEECGIELAIK